MATPANKPISPLISRGVRGKKVKTHWFVGVPAVGNRGKQQKMGHVKKKDKLKSVLCPAGHMAAWVHLDKLRRMRMWCATCQKEIVT